MTSPGATLTAPDRIELRHGETAAIPVPEGRIVLRSDTSNDRREAVVVLEPHGDARSHELARFVLGSYDATQMLLVSLAALDTWR